MRQGDVGRACDALAGLGYRPLHSYSLTSALKTDYHFPMLLEGKVSLLAEVHWSPVAAHLYVADEDLIWSHVVSRSDGLQVLDGPMTAVQLAAHLASHRYVEARILLDVKDSWSSMGETERQVAIDLAGRLGLGPTLDYALLLAGEGNAGTDVSSRRARLLWRLVPSIRQANDPQLDYLGRIFAFFLARPDRVLSALIAIIFPAPDMVAWKMGARSNLAGALLLPLRPFAPIWRLLRKHLSSG